MACTNYLATFNNPPKDVVDDPEAWLKSFYERSNAVYVNGQLERGANGTLHV